MVEDEVVVRHIGVESFVERRVGVGRVIAGILGLIVDSTTKRMVLEGGDEDASKAEGLTDVEIDTAGVIVRRKNNAVCGRK
jgi:hypothetical protein